MARNKMISIRVTDEEHRLIKKRAKLKRMSVSQMFLMFLYRDCD